MCMIMFQAVIGLKRDTCFIRKNHMCTIMFQAVIGLKRDTLSTRYNSVLKVKYGLVCGVSSCIGLKRVLCLQAHCTLD